MLLWWDVIIAIYHAVYVKTYWRSNITGDLPVYTDFLKGSRCFLLVHCVNVWFLKVNCFSSNVFLKLLKDHSRIAEKQENWYAALEYGLLVYKNLLSEIETHFKSSKASRGSYLGLEVSFFVKIFEFYLVTRSL